jgi:hypothetical protein
MNGTAVKDPFLCTVRGSGGCVNFVPPTVLPAVHSAVLLIVLCGEEFCYSSKSLFIMSSTGIATGINRGFPVEKRAKVVRPSHEKAVRVYIKFATAAVFNCFVELCRDCQREPKTFAI